MQRLPILLLLPVSLLLVFILLIEQVWLPGVYSEILEEKVAEVNRSAYLIGEAIKVSPSSANTLISSLDIDEEGRDWRTIFIVEPDSSDNHHHIVPPLGYGSGAHFIHYLIEGSSLQLGAWINKDAIFLQIKNQVRTYEMTSIVLVCVLFLLTLLLQRRLLLIPIRQLIRASEQIMTGDTDCPLPRLEKGSVLAPLVSSLITLRHSLAEQALQSKAEIKALASAKEYFKESHQIARLGCWEWRLSDDLFWCSESLKNILSITDKQPLSLERFVSSAHPADRHQLLTKLKKMKDDLQAVNISYRVSVASLPASLAGIRHVQLLSDVSVNESGKITRIYGTCQDITEHKDSEASLKKLSSAITHGGSSVMITDVIGAIEYVNPKFTETTGYSLEEVVGQQPELLSRKWISADCYDALWQSLLSGKHWRGELQSRKKNSGTFWSLVSISPINNDYGELTHFVIVSEDVTELKDAHARMERLALYDELTGLPNRRFFFSELSRLFDQDIMEYPAVVMLLDLDFFKTINDTQGHSAGDMLLVEVAQRLINCLHDSDIAARLGGDEFAILIHPVLDSEHVEAMAEKIVYEIARPFHINEHEMQISTSLGLAWLPKDGHSPEALLKNADLAMYQAKEMGRNQYRFFTESLHDQLQAYIRFSREMPKSLDAHNFELHYQPQVDLKTGAICSVEALVRWNHPELGVISPQDFIPVAEETGFIVPLGRWVLQAACQAIKYLAQHRMSHIKVAINLSSRQFRDPNLLTMIRQMLEEYAIDPACLELEITESLLMHDIGLAIEILKELQGLGITIAIDDFGIGYSSFSYLKTLPINVLKIDRAFIKDIPEHLDDMEITAAIISMAHRLNMKVVAEGIETEVQRVFLEEHHCDVGQGYLFSHPVMLNDLLALLMGRNSQ